MVDEYEVLLKILCPGMMKLWAIGEFPTVSMNYNSSYYKSQTMIKDLLSASKELMNDNIKASIEYPSKFPCVEIDQPSIM
jgi:hypothetical protein